MFLQLLRSKNKLCDHPDDCFTIVEPKYHVLKCRECDFFLNLDYYFLHSLSEMNSIDHAEAYVRWSGGDRSIPCKIPLGCYLKEITPVYQLKTTFETIENANRLFRILQQPLEKGTPPPTPEPADLAFFQETVSRTLRSALNRATGRDGGGAEDYFEGDGVRTIVCVALHLLLKHVESVPYFSVVVPHLKSVHRRGWVGVCNQVSLSRSLSDQFYERVLHSASDIHCNYSRTCAAFDAVHVAAFCYLCRDDPGVVYDLVADFVGRLCRGYHDDAFSSPFLPKSVLPSVKQRLDFSVSSESSNVDIHFFLERLREGGEGLADCFSDSFFKTYWRLKSVLYKEEEEANDFDYKYPRVLFRDYGDYYAFWVALCHYAKETKATSKNINEILVGIVSAPGVVSRCKELYRLVRKTLSKIKKFHECFVLQEFHKSISYDDGVLFEEKREIETTYLFTRNMWKSFLGILDLPPKTSLEWLMVLPLFSKNDPDLKPVYLDDIYNVWENKKDNEID